MSACIHSPKRNGSQLERVQRMRQGEDVPPPMTMEVSERP